MAIDGTIKNKLPVLRAEKGWSQAHLAELVNVSRQTINSLEKNKYNPSLKLAFTIAEVLEVEVTEVFQFEREDKETDEELALRLAREAQEKKKRKKDKK